MTEINPAVFCQTMGTCVDGETVDLTVVSSEQLAQLDEYIHHAVYKGMILSGDNMYIRDDFVEIEDFMMGMKKSSSQVKSVTETVREFLKGIGKVVCGFFDMDCGVDEDDDDELFFTENEGIYHFSSIKLSIFRIRGINA